MVKLEAQIIRMLCLPFIGIVYALQRHILVVVKQTIEFGSKTVKSEFLEEELDVCFDERSVA